MLRTVTILLALASAAVAHFSHSFETTVNPSYGYGYGSYGDWNGHGVVSDVVSRNYRNNGPWFTGNGVVRGANWNNGYGYTGWNRYNQWYGPSATTVAAANDVVYDTYAPTYANSVYGASGWPSARYARHNYDNAAAAYNRYW